MIAEIITTIILTAYFTLNLTMTYVLHQSDDIKRIEYVTIPLFGLFMLVDDILFKP